ncbi:MAG TPA: chemotaxis protein CheB [Sphingopyxis sp.]|nr:chemotaxis protein CheB [Sphingopyxis sp.]
MSEVAARCVVIGASAGAVQALSEILPALPADFPLPILVVVHIPSDRQNILPSLLQAKCRMTVREAEDKEPALAGVVYFAPPDYHLLAEADGSLSLSSDEEVLYSRPSIDVLFESAADAYGAALIGIVLTGANPDGAKGLKAIADAGGTALVEDPAAAYAAEMPTAALKECAAARVVPLAEMAPNLMKECGV